MKKINSIAIVVSLIILFPSINGCKNDDEESACPTTVTDIDGNVYNTVSIGTQCWMKENLKTSKYSDGSSIGEIEDSVTWANIHNNSLQAPAWCYYGQNVANNGDYGKLYNWYAVADSRNLCPTGWHVPSIDDWIIAIDYLGGTYVAGGSMKEVTLWQSPNTDATNSSGFSGRPGGYRDNHSEFYDVGRVGGWWSSTEYDSGFAWYCYLHCSNGVIDRDSDSENYGFSVRCIKDE